MTGCSRRIMTGTDVGKNIVIDMNVAARTGRSAARGLVVLLALISTGCARPLRQATVLAPVPLPVSPFADSSVSFFVRRSGLVGGELVIVRVCVGADHSIVSADVVESSGDPQFDQLATMWARQVQLRASAPLDGATVAPCGAVRVEMRRALDTPMPGTREHMLG
jgi:hypothetical protein